VLARFPALAPDTPGFVIADEATLASALDAQLPGQGRPDELWLSSPHQASVRAALGTGPLARLGAAFRADIEHQLRAAPIARGMLGVLVAAAALSGALALLGLLVALLGAAREEGVERDLIAQGVGPRGIRTELRMRLLLTGVLGACVGLGIAALLTRLAVASVRAAAGVATPHPPLVAVANWFGLALWGAAALAALAATSWVATASLIGRGRGA
jgi:hypothetical protein